MTGELFHWSYRHLNENANNLIKGLERAERGRKRNQTKVLCRKRRSELEEVDERGTTRDRGRNRWRGMEEERGANSEGIDGEKEESNKRGERKGRKLRGMSGREEKKEQGNDT